MNGDDREVGDRRKARQALAALWVILFAAGAAAAGSRWNSWIGGLGRVGEPAPLTAPVSGAPAPSAGERAVAEARHLLENGQPAAALNILQTVSPQDAAYPFARTLSAQAQESLRRIGSPNR